mgnify:CR=1 FL=1
MKSNKRPGSMIGCFSDSSWYPEEAKKEKIGSYLFVLISTQIKRNSIFLPYFTIGILGIIINWMFNLIIKVILKYMKGDKKICNLQHQI